MVQNPQIQWCRCQHSKHEKEKTCEIVCVCKKCGKPIKHTKTRKSSKQDKKKKKMKQFYYVITDVEKRIKKGTIHFESEDQLRKHFHSLKYIIRSLEEVKLETDTPKYEFISDIHSLAKILIPCVVVCLILLAVIKQRPDTPKAVPTISTSEKIAPKIKELISQEPRIVLPKKTPVTPGKVIPTPNPEVATIKLKGIDTKENGVSSALNSTPYRRARKFYNQAKQYCYGGIDKNLVACRVNCRKAIEAVQSALLKGEGDEKKLKLIINDCRRMIRQ